jgi:hypothetical protein
MMKWAGYWLKTAKFIMPGLDPGIQGHEAIN